MGQASELHPAPEQHDAAASTTSPTPPQPAHTASELHIHDQQKSTAGTSPHPLQPTGQPNYAPYAASRAHADPDAVVTPLHLLGPAPACIDCPYCSRRGLTRVDESDSGMTFVAGIGLGVICICLACLPCCLHWFQDRDHFCAHCGRRVAHVPQGSGVAQVVAPPPQQQQGYQMTPQPKYAAQQQQQTQQQPDQQKQLPQEPLQQQQGVQEQQEYHQGPTQQQQHQQPGTPPPSYI
ncbi:Piwi-like protein 2 [Pestalotiopsis sp. 9143b]|nr:Piwi-like protein 2 [Pestalotiopsis sp. 9143b]